MKVLFERKMARHHNMISIQTVWLTTSDVRNQERHDIVRFMDLTQRKD